MYTYDKSSKIIIEILLNQINRDHGQIICILFTTLKFNLIFKICIWDFFKSRIDSTIYHGIF
jgi:hypothetical protein